MPEARELWAAAQRGSSRMHALFDGVWFATLLAERATPERAAESARASSPGESLKDAGLEQSRDRRQDWGEAPDSLGFVGRANELSILRDWVVDQRCRLVSVVGIGGIGKTSMVAALAQEVAPSFERVFWRSLRDGPPPGDWLAGAVGFLSDQQLVPPAAQSERLAALLQLLRERHCLLVLDNVETLFEPGQQEGRYREGLAGYGHLFHAAGESAHQSCLILTSRESPADLAALAGNAVRKLQLGGLNVDEAQELMARMQLVGTREQWAELVARFGGNGLALKMVGESIRELFGGAIGAFLHESGDSIVFGGVRRLLFEQIRRSSLLEQQVLQRLAVAREPVSLKTLVAITDPFIGRAALIEAAEGLRAAHCWSAPRPAGPRRSRCSRWCSSM
jgi:NACHT domain